MPKPYQANLVVSSILIIFGLWAFLTMTAESRSVTALIPVFFGLLLAAFTPWFKRENKIAAHLVALLTLLIAVALYMPLKGAIGRGDLVGIFRVATMMLVSLAALAVYIKSFRDVRRARSKTES